MKFKTIFYWVLAFLLAVGAGLYFRTYSFRAVSLPSPEKLASVLVERAITRQIHQELMHQNLALSGDDKLKLAREQAQRIKKDEPASYRAAVEKAAEEIRQSRPSEHSRRYLLEADPYYYYYLVQQIRDTGRIGSQYEGSRYFQPLMHAPEGYWAPINWHPYVGWHIYRLLRIFQPELELMEGIGWVPLILTIAACFCFFVFARSLSVNSFQFFIGAVVLMLSPIFIQRSGWGWFDTDPYNYIFPFLILAFVVSAIRKTLPGWVCAVGAGLLTGLYSRFWTGWAFMLVLTPAALAGAWLTARFIMKKNAAQSGRFGFYTLVHFVAAAVSSIIFMTPAGFWNSVSESWEVLRKFSLADPDIWPNLFLTVGEAHGASLIKLIFLSGNYITFTVAVLGCAVELWNAWKQRSEEAVFKNLFLFFFSVPLFILPFKTERFGILFLIPLCIWSMYGAQFLRIRCAQILSRFSRAAFWQKWRETVSVAVIFIFFLPLPLVTAHVVSTGVSPIMDDAWYDTMMEIKHRSQVDAIVNTWWPPGYFIVSLANRKVIADGGTQHLRESYWTARILVTENEKEAAGLLRMLNSSGNQAFLTLEKAGMETADAMDLITQVAPLSEAEALLQLPDTLSPETKMKFLEGMFGVKPLPQTLLLVYSDMIDQNLAVTVVGRWNFRKAKEIQEKKRTDKYLNDFFRMTDSVLKYTPAADVQRRSGDMLFFANGLAVNLKEKDAFIFLPEKQLKGRPMSFFYLEDGKLHEKKYEEDLLNMGALLVEDKPGVYRAVLADPHLIRSLMFRFYYMKGAGLEYFKPFSDTQDARTANRVRVFELQTDVLNKYQPRLEAVEEKGSEADKIET